LDTRKYDVHASSDPAASRSPRRLHAGVPADPSVTSTTPTNETAAHTISRRPTTSPSSRPATSSTSAGCSAEMTATSAIDVFLIAEKKNAISMPRSAPPGADARIIGQDGRRPVVRNAASRISDPSHRRCTAKVRGGRGDSLISVFVQPQITTANRTADAPTRER
jgi:hypothetical protein